MQDVLSDAHGALPLGGERIISGAKGNPYLKIDQFVSVEKLQLMGFEVVQYKTPLTLVENYAERFGNINFGTSGGASGINPSDMITFILRKSE